MTEMQVLSLYLMVCLGGIPLAAIPGLSLTGWKRNALIAWAVIWCGPGLAHIWMKGVLG